MSDTDEARGADEIKKPRVAECMYHTFLSCASFDCFVLDPGIRLDRVQAQVQPTTCTITSRATAAIRTITVTITITFIADHEHFRDGPVSTFDMFCPFT